MKKFTLMMIVALFALTANAQINFKDSKANMDQAGTTKDTLSNGTIADVTYYQIAHNWHFNTNKPVTIAGEDPAKPGFLGAPQKASTRKGWRVTGVRPNGSVTGLVHGNLGKTQGYTGGGDPVHFASVADLRSFLGNTSLKYQENSIAQNDLDSAVTCVIDVAAGDAALAVYPGMYKKTDTRVYYNLGGSIATSDLSFDVMTVDPGNSGKTVNVKLIVSIANKLESNPSVDNNTGIGKGADKTDSTATAYPGSARFEKVIYTSGAAVKHVNICQEFGLNIDTLDYKKVIIALITESSDLTPEPGKYDPVIGYDNFKLKFWHDTPSLPVTSLDKVSQTAVNVIGKTGSIELSDSASGAVIYSISGQKVATIRSGMKSVSVPAGIYIVKSGNKLTPTKVVVK